MDIRIRGLSSITKLQSKPEEVTDSVTVNFCARLVMKGRCPTGDISAMEELTLKHKEVRALERIAEELSGINSRLASLEIYCLQKCN